MTKTQKKTAAKSSKKKSKLLGELPSQPDPRAPLDLKLMLRAASPVLRRLEADLRERADASDSVRARLEAEHKRLCDARRCGEEYSEWLNAFVEQVAAAWLLACVFVRTLEDRGLLDHNRLAGPGAADSLREFLQLAPSLSERDYIQLCLRELLHLPAADALFGQHENPIWLITPSAEGARELLELFRMPNPEAPALRFGQADTRFLGDLYQDLNENVRARYALLQTPDFVVEYVLDRTLEPAIERFGLEHADLIDPTCGSGHFLLATFERLFDRFQQVAPNDLAGAVAERALGKVFGTDINPYAVAISRFRLTLAFLEKCGIERFRKVPKLMLNVVVADSLLYNERAAKLESKSSETANGRHFALEHAHEADALLTRKAKFAAVIGNPPYITVKDSALRERYRDLYPSAFGGYSMGVPFTERFFELTRPDGRVGMITANSFMKREFGSKLVTDFLPKVDLDLIVNSAGAYIPGHGTPTVLLFGNQRNPRGDTVRVVLSKRGEPTTPENPAKGQVWLSIAEHSDEVGYEDEYISVSNLARISLAVHPWSLGGGGAGELRGVLEARAEKRLGDVVDDIGLSIILGEDDVFLRPQGRQQWSNIPLVPLVIGEEIRDWTLSFSHQIVRPFDGKAMEVTTSPAVQKELWPWKAVLASRIVSGSTTMKQAGRQWFDVRRLARAKHTTPLSITFAFVATHNHFVLDRGGKVFNRSAPIIKLPDGATEDDHLALLAYLNSSTACFWMKQMMMNKGATSDRGVLQADEDKFRFEFDAAKMAQTPLPPGETLQDLTELGSRCDEIGRISDVTEYATILADSRLHGQPLVSAWNAAAAVQLRRRRRLVALQEEIDWRVYRGFGLVSDDGLVSSATEWNTIELDEGKRPFLSADAKELLIKRRADAIRESKILQLIETPVFKRRWYRSQGKFNADAVTTATLQAQALLAFLCDRVEDFVRSQRSVVARSVLKKILEKEAERTEQLCAQAFSTAFSSPALSHEALLVSNSAPAYAAQRYTETGIGKYLTWCLTWALQRREDAGEKVRIPVPPKYDQKDFRKPEYWRLRGKLDVPKERFISYPGLESDEDGELIYGWAGWDHAQRARALVEVYQGRKDGEGWTTERLTPALVGMHELLPWVKQWHNEPDPQYDGACFGDDLAGFLAEELRHHGLTEADLLAWRPDSTPGAHTAKAATGKKSKPPKPIERDTRKISPANNNNQKRRKEAV